MYVCRAAAAIEAGPADDVLVELKRILLRSASPATAVRAAYASARVYELRRDFEKALFYNRIARRHAEALGDESILAHCDNQSGMLLTVDSRFEEAAEVYRRALERTAGREGVSSVFRAVWRDNLGYCLIALDRVPEGLALVHEAFEALEKEGARSYTVYPAPRPLLRLPEERPLRGGPLFRRVRARARPLCGEPAVEKSFLYLLGETCHLAGDDAAARGLLRPPREPLPGIQEPPRVSRGLRLPQRDQPPELTVKRRLITRRLVSAASLPPSRASLALAGSSALVRGPRGRGVRGAREGRHALRGLRRDLRQGHHRR